MHIILLLLSTLSISEYISVKLFHSDSLVKLSNKHGGESMRIWGIKENHS